MNDTKTKKYIESNPERVESWAIELFGLYASKLIQEVNDKNILIGSVCNNKNQYGPCIRALKYLGYISYAEDMYIKVPSNYCFYTEKELTYQLTVNHEKFLEEAAQYGEPFEFELKAKKANGNLYQSYERYNCLKNENFIYIYFNRDDYDIVINKEESSHRFRGSIGTNEVRRIYPKSLKKDLNKTLYKAKRDSYYNERPKEILKLLFDLDTKVLAGNYEDPENSDIINYKLSLGDLNEEDLNTRLKNLKRSKDLVENSINDIERILEELNKFKTPEEYKDYYEKKINEYIAKNAPIKMFDKKDIRIAEISRMVCESKVV